MVTIKDVAKLAGVSYTTVSHVINKTRFVAPETKHKVQKAIMKLNFIPNTNASGLRKKIMKTIGVIGPCSIDHFFAEVIYGINDTCFENNYTVLLCYSEIDLKKEISFINSLIQRNVDGIILNSINDDKTLLKELNKIKKPFAIFQRKIKGLNASFFESDDYNGATQAIEHLISLGHKRIACVYGFTYESHTARQRIYAYKDVLKKYNINLDESFLISGDYCVETSYEVTKKLLSQKNKPTAIFYFSDYMAIAGISAANDLGFNVPGDISIIGYDDFALCPYLKPKLTTVRQDKYKLGRIMAEKIISCAKDKEITNENVIVPVSLIIRESTGPIKY